MSPALLLLAIDVATIVCAALLGVRVLTWRPRSRVAWLVALIALNSICHVVLGRAEHGFWIEPAFHVDVGALAPAMNLARNATPAAFMVLCHVLFTDRPRFPRWLLALVAVQLLLEEPMHLLVPATAALAPFLFETLPTLLQTLFAGIALYWTLATWRADLVERRRRRLRPFTVLVVGVDILLSGLLTRVLIDPDGIAIYRAHVALATTHLLLFAFVLLQITEADLDVGAPAKAVSAPTLPNADDAALARLETLMQNDHAHREAGLTLARLAERVGLPEYRLRRLIHERLGFANFNAFLHRHRIADACRQLRDPAMAGVPILTIALSVGYQSANTFNRGFREVMGVTPSTYRARPPEVQATD